MSESADGIERKLKNKHRQGHGKTVSFVNSKGLIKMYKYAIFDLDGTLLDTLGDLHAAVNHALRTFNFPERTKNEVRRFIGNGVVKLMERSTPDGIDEKTQEECLEVFRKYYLEHMKDMTAPYEGVLDMLKTLKEKGVKTAVVSNKLHTAVEGLCEDYFAGLIDVAIGVSDESERKPNPVNVFKTMDKFGFRNSEFEIAAKGEKRNNGNSAEHTIIYIGDSEVDVQTAKNAGLSCIGVTWGFRDEEELKRAGAEFIADDVSEVLGVIL